MKKEVSGLGGGFKADEIKFKTLSIHLDAPLTHLEVPYFRGCIIKQVGIENEWFHNHNNQDEGAPYHYRYPLIQYKSVAGHPVLVFLGDCSEEAHKLFASWDWELNIRGDIRPATLKEFVGRETSLYLGERLYHYEINNWLPFNSKNYVEYQALKSNSLEEKAFLERILTGHILNFATAAKWQIQKKIEVYITHLHKRKTLEMKENMMQAFSFRFASNVSLPDYIGLGRNVAYGFGWLHRSRQFKHTNHVERVFRSRKPKEGAEVEED